MKRIILFSIWLFAGLLSCSKSELVSFGDIMVGFEEEIEFKSGLKLKVVDIEDSRCPADAVCIWEGQALVTLWLEFKDDVETVQIAKCNGSSTLCEKSTIEILDHRFQVIEVNPFPILDVEVKDNEWEVLLQVEQL